jgi:L-serine dehydratase
MHELSISEVMLRREVSLSETSRKKILEQVDECLRVMDASTNRFLDEETVTSMGGLIGGESRKLHNLESDKAICGSTLHKAIMSALSVAETNASMGVIVAAPTAGSAGVVPAAILSVYEDCDIGLDQLRMGLINAGAIGYLCTLNGSVAGAEAGCQAEVGSASAMAASALVEMLGGTPEQCCDAASIALSNLLGLACDPVRGLVEVPCQTRNTMGAVGAYTAAELAMAGVGPHIPLDEMIQITYDVGRALPESIRETAKGGCAVAPSMCAECSGKQPGRKPARTCKSHARYLESVARMCQMQRRL